VGNRGDEIFVGADVRGVATLGYDFAASLVFIFCTVCIYRKSYDVENERKSLEGLA